MKRNYFILIAFSLTSLFHAQEAKADWEVIQSVLTVAKGVVDKASNAIKDIQSQVKDLTKDSLGVMGAYKDIKKEYNDTISQVESAKSQVEGLQSDITDSVDSAQNIVKNKDFSSIGLNRLNSQVNKVKLPSFLTDVKESDNTIDKEKLAAAVSEQYSATIGSGYDTQVVQEKELEISSIQRENVADLLAESYNLLYRLDQEQEVTEKQEEQRAASGDETTVRDEVQRRLEAEMKTVARENRINSLKSAMYNIEYQGKTRSLQKFVKSGTEEGED